LGVAESLAENSLTKIKVHRVVDGDTIEIIYQGKKEYVRFIGVNTPETKHPTKGVQPYGPEASDFTTKVLAGRDVWLEFDVKLRDQYGRLLAYVWLEGPADDFPAQRALCRLFQRLSSRSPQSWSRVMGLRFGKQNIEP